MPLTFNEALRCLFTGSGRNREPRRCVVWLSNFFEYTYLSISTSVSMASLKNSFPLLPDSFLFLSSLFHLVLRFSETARGIIYEPANSINFAGVSLLYGDSSWFDTIDFYSSNSKNTYDADDNDKRVTEKNNDRSVSFQNSIARRKR